MALAMETILGASGGRDLQALLPRTFEVICAGEAVWNVAPPGARPAAAASLRFTPGGGAVRTSVALAQQGVRVGLAAAFGDDTFGRTLRDRIAAAGVDVDAVVLTPPETNLVFVDGFGAAQQLMAFREEEQPLSVPLAWSSQVLLLSGLSPALTYGAALCKAARAGRRAGSIVVVDANARRHVWSGRDSRAIRALLKEVDVARFSAEDLRALLVDEATVRDLLRPSAVLLLRTATGETIATGPFGEIAWGGRGSVMLRPIGAGDRFTAGVCAELARAGNPGEHDIALWERALRRGEAAALGAPLER
jgi:sugar/nucleoside kinase (ribokinase family)